MGCGFSMQSEPKQNGRPNAEQIKQKQKLSGKQSFEFDFSNKIKIQKVALGQFLQIEEQRKSKEADKDVSISEENKLKTGTTTSIRKESHQLFEETSSDKLHQLPNWTEGKKHDTDQSEFERLYGQNNTLLEDQDIADTHQKAEESILKQEFAKHNGKEIRLRADENLFLRNKSEEPEGNTSEESEGNTRDVPEGPNDIDDVQLIKEHNVELLKHGLEVHNELRFYPRALHGVPPLTSSDDICRLSQQWAEYLAKTNKFEHSPDDLRGRYGENLWGADFLADLSYEFVKSVVLAFYNEIQVYDYSKAEFTVDTGHFTQVVWKNTKELGMAIAKNEQTGYTVVVCNYGPQGNVTGWFKENVPPPAMT